MIDDSRDTAPSLHARGRGREVNSSALAPYLFENILQRIAAHCSALQCISSGRDICCSRCGRDVCCSLYILLAPSSTLPPPLPQTPMHTHLNMHNLEHQASFTPPTPEAILAVDKDKHTAPHCTTLQHTATHCNALEHTAKDECLPTHI